MTADEAFEKWWEGLAIGGAIENDPVRMAVIHWTQQAWLAARAHYVEEALKILERMKYNPDRSFLGAIEEIRSALLETEAAETNDDAQ